MKLDIDLEEHGRESMYETLCDEFSEEEVDGTLEAQVVQHITQMFDNREQLKRMEKQV